MEWKLEWRLTENAEIALRYPLAFMQLVAASLVAPVVSRALLQSGWFQKDSAPHV